MFHALYLYPYGSNGRQRVNMPINNHQLPAARSGCAICLQNSFNSIVLMKTTLMDEACILKPKFVTTESENKKRQKSLWSL